ncbi:putative gustatory receptor 28a isoform X4 [Leptopilina heterotoma]|uniref:putative gustatory receptor 28a isoform X4 n=1 Tax=Leptopilina heterotoma TaxID=63436 RepID=UPI001CA8EF4D|nr:putative gustatory receptor 28a isoform X4 [Leptopilina heterotoma]
MNEIKQKVSDKEKLKNDEDIYSVLDSVSWNWKTLGVIIFAMRGEMGNRRYIIKKSLIAYNIFLSLLVATSSIDLIFFDNSLTNIARKLEFDAKLLIHIKETFNFIVLLDMTVWKLISANKFRKIIASFARQDKIVIEIGSRINYKANMREIKVFVRLVSIANLLLSFQEIYYGISISTLIDWSNWWLPSLIYKSNLSLFFCLIWILGMRFKVLNQKLNLIVKSTHPQSLENIKVLRIIANTHCQLCKIGKQIINIFIPSLIICGIQTFIFVTLMLYRLILDIQHQKNFVTIGNNMFGILITGAQIVIIVFICNWTKKKATFPEKLIHEIKINQLNPAFFEMIQSFSTQLLHQKLTFSVGGLFTLDSGLLQSIAGAITTYLVIFIQFEF